MAGNVSLLTGVRRLFYLVTPNETSFRDVSDVPNYTRESVPSFMLFVAIELTISLIKGDKKMRINDGVTSMSAGLFSRLPLYLMRTVELGSYVWVFEKFCVYELAWDSAWTWWLAFLAVDLGYYWFHRLAHEVNIMWAAHQVHHSSEDYNLTTALRQSVLQKYTSWMFYLPLALFIPPSVFLVHQQFNILFQFWIHTEYVKSLGPLEYILNTPSHHRVHHGRNPYCIDKNYAGTLIVWDRLFGTFQAEDETVVYGLTHPVGTFEPFKIQFCHLHYMWGRFKEEKGLANKLSVIFKGPGWERGKPRLGNIEDIPKVCYPVEKYSSCVPPWCGLYICIHFFIIIQLNQQIAASYRVLPVTFVLLSEVFVLLSLTSFGRLFDNSDYSPLLELFRCVLFLTADLILGVLGYQDLKSRPLAMRFVQYWYITSVVIWIVRQVTFYSGRLEKNKQM
ncbi:alkylglycerol monooxygenase-like [Liolophura sinensis]|uniref:alkylglycerol monooxygenase-like n=1 Tax=Liolophura sinensis TaxID=3198878 RepID=UPI0031581460